MKKVLGEVLIAAGTAAVYKVVEILEKEKEESNDKTNIGF
jgi:hypothetical protein